MPPGDDIGSRDGTWLSLSLDADVPRERITSEPISGIGPRDAPHATPPPPQPPPPGSSQGDHAAPVLGDAADSALTAKDASAESVVLADSASSSRQSVSVSDSGEAADTSSDGATGASSSDSISASSSDSSSSDSISMDSSGEIAATELPAPIEEVTEAVDVPVPAPIQCTLADEVLPWPPLLVAPTLVLPGAWPPPPGTLGRSQPSALGEAAQADFEELSLDGQTGATSLGDVSMELSIEDEAPTASQELEMLSSNEVPPVRGTLDEMPVVARSAPADLAAAEALTTSRPEIEPAAGRPVAPPTEDDDIPTEVSQRDALEEALAVLRTADPGTAFAASNRVIVETLNPDDDASDEAATTAEDLVSLELLPDDEDLVDPAVRSDLDLAAVAIPAPRQGQPTWIGLGAPTLVVTPAAQRAWIDLSLQLPEPKSAEPTPPPAAPSTTERTTDLRALARREEAGAAAQSTGRFGVTDADDAGPAEDADGDDWLSDVPPDELS